MIKLTGEAAERYKLYLSAYRATMRREDTAAIRCEAFFCARAEGSRRPWWI